MRLYLSFLERYHNLNSEFWARSYGDLNEYVRQNFERLQPLDSSLECFEIIRSVSILCWLFKELSHVAFGASSHLWRLFEAHSLV